MTDLHPSDSDEHRDEPGKTRTWWHPLFARLLDHASGTAYQVLEEVSVGRLPLRVDILLIRRVAGPLPFATWLAENDVLAQRGQPILSLVSRVFLRERKRIIQQLTDAGHLDLLYYALQQVAQFRKSGERFTMDHKDVKYMGEVEEELQMAVLESIPPERRMEGIPP
jgi:hypothetical protein